MTLQPKCRGFPYWCLTLVGGAVAARLGCGSRAHGQTITTLYWDTNAAVAGSGNAGGDWNNDPYWATSATEPHPC
jgi:hypothetical protein